MAAGTGRGAGMSAQALLKTHGKASSRRRLLYMGDSAMVVRRHTSFWWLQHHVNNEIRHTCRVRFYTTFYVVSSLTFEAFYGLSVKGQVHQTLQERSRVHPGAEDTHNMPTKNLATAFESKEVLLDQIQRGGDERERAMRQIYEDFAPHWLRFFVHCSLSKPEAEDALQACMLRIAQGAGGFKATGSAQSWMWQIARNCLKDQLLARHRRGAAELPLDAIIDDSHAIDHLVDEGSDRSSTALQRCVSEALQAFARAMPERAYALTLYVEGYSSAWIGQHIGRTAGATRQFLAQTRTLFKPFAAHCVKWLEA
jgi:RNA polymerase sigma factor (sigma-70 family)